MEKINSLKDVHKLNERDFRELVSKELCLINQQIKSLIDLYAAHRLEHDAVDEVVKILKEQNKRK